MMVKIALEEQMKEVWCSGGTGCVVFPGVNKWCVEERIINNSICKMIVVYMVPFVNF